MRPVELLRDSVGLMRNAKQKMKTLSVWIMGVPGNLEHAGLEMTATATLLGTTVSMEHVAAVMVTRIVQLETFVRNQNVS